MRALQIAASVLQPWPLATHLLLHLCHLLSLARWSALVRVLALCMLHTVPRVLLELRQEKRLIVGANKP